VPIVVRGMAMPPGREASLSTTRPPLTRWEVPRNPVVASPLLSRPPGLLLVVTVAGVGIRPHRDCMTRKASHPQYTKGILRSRMMN